MRERETRQLIHRPALFLLFFARLRIFAAGSFLPFRSISHAFNQSRGLHGPARLTLFFLLLQVKQQTSHHHDNRIVRRFFFFSLCVTFVLFWNKTVRLFFVQVDRYTWTTQRLQKVYNAHFEKCNNT